MKWYDRQPQSWFGRWLHHRWFRSWNQIEEIGGGSAWLWLTRPFIYRQRGDYEITFVAVFLAIPLLFILFRRLIDWIFNVL